MGIDARLKMRSGYAHETHCAECDTDAELMAKVASNGRTDYKMICPQCGRSVSSAIGLDVLRECGVDLKTVPVFSQEEWHAEEPSPCPRCDRRPRIGKQITSLQELPVWFCDVCGKVVEPATDRQVQRYKLRWDELENVRVYILRAMPYEEYLTTPEWQFTRRAKAWSVDWACEFCGYKADERMIDLQVHHRRERGAYKRLGSERADDLMCLCRRCHRARHRIDQQGDPFEQE